ncbi:Sulfotransferase 4A1 [Habropoda laboriosa]|uniref:Sulfotransferase 4A1 n=1 Tax=Habropoda laboriosa TaxID=597456 RepID=A0A0L7QKY3_9HYME|nr:Sulfotransferase 4A1 [Habropoda laboriosa]
MAPQIESNNDLDKILRENFTSEFRKGYITVTNVCLPSRYDEFAEVIENFEVRDDDVWVCSFPKTGTTWTQEMIWCIANDLDFEGAKVRLAERFPFLEYSVLFDYTTILPRYPEMKLPQLVLDSVEYTKNRASPRFIKTHLPFTLLPRQLRTGEKKPKIVYVARNPKDTCVSYYYHCRLMEGYRGDFNNFSRLFLGEKRSFAPYWDHVLDFWNRRTDSNVLFLKYEDMKANLSTVIEKSSAFFSKIMSSDETKALTQHLSFANMKSNPAVNYEDHIKMNRQMKSINVDGEFIRSGKVDQWREEMSESVIERFDNLTKDKFSSQNLFF